MAISLKAARVNANLTQEEAAKRIGVTPFIISKWEQGKVTPSLKRLPAILQAYGVKYEDINFSSS
jgi:transcriptional regulator with XRE-family HTH domain